MQHPRDDERPESEPAGEADEVAQRLAGGAPERVGWFRYFFDDERWEWSPQVQRMHGYTPGTVTPTTELVLAYKHPADVREIADTLALIRQARQAFSSRHRIVDVDGRVHRVVVVGDQLSDQSGVVVGTHGFYIDVTPEEQARQDQMTAEASQIVENRAVIEQAKGMLILIYGIDADNAFELLAWLSQHTNVKLGPLAEQITTDFKARKHGETLPYDNLLLTAHTRISDTGSGC